MLKACILGKQLVSVISECLHDGSGVTVVGVHLPNFVYNIALCFKGTCSCQTLFLQRDTMLIFQKFYFPLIVTCIKYRIQLNNIFNSTGKMRGALSV
jgi:hypothetical protein